VYASIRGRRIIEVRGVGTSLWSFNPRSFLCGVLCLFGQLGARGRGIGGDGGLRVPQRYSPKRGNFSGRMCVVGAASTHLHHRVCAIIGAEIVFTYVLHYYFRNELCARVPGN
jgi:hypothetical protein